MKVVQSVRNHLMWTTGFLRVLMRRPCFVSCSRYVLLWIRFLPRPPGKRVANRERTGRGPATRGETRGRTPRHLPDPLVWLLARYNERMAPRDFRESLKRQLGFVERSCHAFDVGFHDEAIRIAQCVRVMMHDTKSQTSVLAHLNAKSITLLSTCLDIAAKVRQFGGRALHFNGMGQLETGPHGARYYPKLGGSGMFNHSLPVDQWLNETVFILDPDTWVSREGVVLAAADKDGGAHVDAQLTPVYERLIDSGDLGVFVDEKGSETPITGHHYVALRQIGHELLSSPDLLRLAS